IDQDWWYLRPGLRSGSPSRTILGLRPRVRAPWRRRDSRQSTRPNRPAVTQHQFMSAIVRRKVERPLRRGRGHSTWFRASLLLGVRRCALEVEHDDRFGTHHPGIVSSWGEDGIARTSLILSAVLEFRF